MELNEERFQVKCQFTKDNAELEFIGKIDTPNPDKSLDPYFLALHSRALTDRIQNAVLIAIFDVDNFRGRGDINGLEPV